MKSAKKIVALVAAFALVICLTIGGTLAWLSTKTGDVVNTFTVGDINITLDETDLNSTSGGKTTEGNTYKMVPGATITKDPQVTVKANSEACWLFVQITESTNAKFSDYMTYEVLTKNDKGETEWTALPGVTGVYYREVDATTTDLSFDVLKDNKVSVLDDVTKEQLNALTADTYPTLTFTAYAVQKSGITTVADAWSQAQSAVVPTTTTASPSTTPETDPSSGESETAGE